MSEGNGKLPEGWVHTELAQIADLIMGQSPPGASTNDQGMGVPLIGGASDVTESVGPVPSRFTTAPTKLCTPGDIIVCIRATIGRPVLAHEESCLGRGVAGVRPRRVNPAWLLEFLRSSETELENRGTGSTFKTVNRTDIASLKVNLPPLPEQDRIVARIQALRTRTRRAREALESVPALLEQLRQSVLASAFRGDLTADWRESHPDVEPASVLLERIRAERRRRWEEAELEKMRVKGKEPRDDQWKEKYEEPEPVNTRGLPELPEGWAWARWEEVGFSQNGRAFPSSEYRETGVRLLRPGNLHVSGSVEWTKETTRFMADEWAARYPTHLVGPNELVMNLTAQSLKDEFLGRICLTGEHERCLLNQRIARLTPIELSSQFCLLLFKSPVFRRFVDGLNTGSLIQHMFTSQVNGFVFPLPPREEQSLIVARVQKALRFNAGVAAVVSDNADAVNDLDRSVLVRAFRGELVPQDPSDEPASVLLERIRVERAQSRPTRGEPRRSGIDQVDPRLTPEQPFAPSSTC